MGPGDGAVARLFVAPVTRVSRGLRLRREVCSGARYPGVHGGSLAMRPANVAKAIW
jgi:hypothetical protein